MKEEKSRYKATNLVSEFMVDRTEGVYRSLFNLTNYAHSFDESW